MDLKMAVAAGAVGALAGCGGAQEGSSAVDSGRESPPDEATVAAFDAMNHNLERLRALSVINVGYLIMKEPEAGPNCYADCHLARKMKLNADVAKRLGKLADAAETAVKSPAPDACADATIEENLAALKALQIVEVQGLIKEEPKNSASCYNLPRFSRICSCSMNNQWRLRASMGSRRPC